MNQDSLRRLDFFEVIQIGDCCGTHPNKTVTSLKNFNAISTLGSVDIMQAR